MWKAVEFFASASSSE